METAIATRTELALEKAESVLECNAGALGILGASNAYQQVWARDAAINGLGLMLSGRPGAAALLRRSLETLRGFQSELGAIPHCVGFPSHGDPALIALNQYKTESDREEEFRPEVDTARAGCVDSSLWYVLAILFGVADERQTHKILEYIHSVGLDDPYPVRVLHPVVHPGDKDWREYYLIRNLNIPYQYHNGGIWAFVGGFYVAALVKAGMHDRAAMQLARLAELNGQGRQDEWEFNEWYHGQTGLPMGFANQSWSAAMYLYAYHSVNEGEPPVFNAGRGW